VCALGSGALLLTFDTSRCYFRVELRHLAEHSMSLSSSRALAPSNETVRGTLDLLILKTLSLEPMHGWAIAQRLEQLSRDSLRVGQGSLYPALQRLEEKGGSRASGGPLTRTDARSTTSSHLPDGAP
jgi:hypothetical protein